MALGYKDKILSLNVCISGIANSLRLVNFPSHCERDRFYSIINLMRELTSSDAEFGVCENPLCVNEKNEYKEKLKSSESNIEGLKKENFDLRNDNVKMLKKLVSIYNAVGYKEND